MQMKRRDQDIFFMTGHLQPHFLGRHEPEFFHFLHMARGVGVTGVNFACQRQNDLIIGLLFFFPQLIDFLDFFLKLPVALGKIVVKFSRLDSHRSVMSQGLKKSEFLK